MEKKEEEIKNKKHPKLKTLVNAFIISKKIKKTIQHNISLNDLYVTAQLRYDTWSELQSLTYQLKSVTENESKKRIISLVENCLKNLEILEFYHAFPGKQGK